MVPVTPHPDAEAEVVDLVSSLIRFDTSNTGELETTKGEAACAHWVAAQLEDSAAQGICVYDADSRVVLFNRAYLELFDLSADVIRPGLSYREVMEHSAARGSEPGPPEYSRWGLPVDKLRYPVFSWQKITLLERTHMRR